MSDDDLPEFGRGDIDEIERQRLIDHYSGPVDAGRQQLAALAVNDFAGAWEQWTPALRRHALRSWVVANQDVLLELLHGDTDELAALPENLEHTANGRRRHPIDKIAWDAFCAAQLEAFHDRPWLELLAADRIGSASATRPIPPHYELVLFVETDPENGVVVYDTPTDVEVFPILAEHTAEGWKIAGFSDTPPPAD